MAVKRLVQKSMGELLLERAIITSDQLQRGRLRQGEKGGYLSQNLIALGFVTEQNIVDCLSCQYGIASLPLDTFSIRQEVVDLIPAEFIRTFGVMPVDKVGSTVSVAMADPLNEGVLQLIQYLTDSSVQVFISKYSELINTIERMVPKDPNALSLTIDQEVLKSFIQCAKTKDKRRSARLSYRQSAEYFIGSTGFKVQIKDISYLGICFESNSFLPVNTTVACRLNNQGAVINTLVKILRVAAVRNADSQDQENSNYRYLIAGTMKALTQYDKTKVIELVKILSQS